MELFHQRGLAPKRSFGQCFLADPNIAKRMGLEATHPGGGTVVELGAGTGALTSVLVDNASRVAAIERDRDLVPLLHELFSSYVESGRLEIVEDDAVTCDWRARLLRGPRPRVVTGNLPYQLTGRLLHRAVSLASELDRAAFMVQKEVADRIAAKVGTRDYGVLTIMVARVFEIQRRIPVPASCFRPRPKVDSSILILRPVVPRPGPPEPLFEDLVTSAFAKRRKTLRNAWRGWHGLSVEDLEQLANQVGISLDARAETITTDLFVRMASLVARS